MPVTEINGFGNPLGGRHLLINHSVNSERWAALFTSISLLGCLLLLALPPKNDAFHKRKKSIILKCGGGGGG